MSSKLKKVLATAAVTTLLMSTLQLTAFAQATDDTVGGETDITAGTYNFELRDAASTDCNPADSAPGEQNFTASDSFDASDLLSGAAAAPAPNAASGNHTDAELFLHVCDPEVSQTGYTNTMTMTSWELFRDSAGAVDKEGGGAGGAATGVITTDAGTGSLLIADTTQLKPENVTLSPDPAQGGFAATPQAGCTFTVTYDGTDTVTLTADGSSTVCFADGSSSTQTAVTADDTSTPGIFTFDALGLVLEESVTPNASYSAELTIAAMNPSASGYSNMLSVSGSGDKSGVTENNDDADATPDDSNARFNLFTDNGLAVNFGASQSASLFGYAADGGAGVNYQQAQFQITPPQFTRAGVYNATVTVTNTHN